MIFLHLSQKNKMCRRGFTLIELMVVIAIVGILAALAVPAYNTYKIKSKIASQVHALDSLNLDIVKYYQKNGVFPGSINVLGVTIPNSSLGYTDVSVNNIRSAAYVISPDGLGFRLHFNLLGLEGIPNYTSPAVTPSSTRSVFLTAVRLIGDTFIMSCGTTGDSNLNMIPLFYMPTICKCSDIVTFQNSGTAACTS